MITYQSVLTPISDLFLLSEVATMWQTDGTAHKLKPRSFHKSAHLQVHLADFHSQCELCLTQYSFVLIVPLFFKPSSDYNLLSISSPAVRKEI